MDSGISDAIRDFAGRRVSQEKLANWCEELHPLEILCQIAKAGKKSFIKKGEVRQDLQCAGESLDQK